MIGFSNTCLFGISTTCPCWVRSSVNFIIRFWISFSKQPDYLEARSEAIERIKQAFDAEGITIPFPTRILDFAVKGGSTLSEVLKEMGEKERE